MTYIPLSDKGYWQIHMDKLLVPTSNGYYNLCTGECEAIIDTGTSLITGPADQISELNRSFLGAKQDLETGSFIIDCDTLDDLPMITFIFNGMEFQLTPDDYVIEVRTKFLKSM